VAIHDSYLIDLCSPDETTYARSFDAFVDDHRRAEALGVRLVNFHPLAACGRERCEAVEIVATRTNLAHEATRGFGTISVIETTRGPGSGSRCPIRRDRRDHRPRR
jgi:deoxyribonuclease-4